MSGAPLAGLLAGDPVEVAPRLLGTVLASTLHGPTVAGRIVEAEAYRGDSDAASHAYRGRTGRNATMFGRPGLLYVYFSYGMHHCCNVVCWPEGRAGAVLIRALRPLEGLDEMRARRGGVRPDRELCSGPGKLCQALAIDRAADGLDLLDPTSPVRLLTGEPVEEGKIGRSQRTGLGLHLHTAGEQWRFFLAGDENVSGGGAGRPRSRRRVQRVAGRQVPPQESAAPRSTTS